MERISFKHSVMFFNFCILISPFYFIVNFEPIIFCLFLILILGISHGALDNIKGKKLFKIFGYKSSVYFYLTYIIISVLIVASRLSISCCITNILFNRTFNFWKLLFKGINYFSGIINR